MLLGRKSNTDAAANDAGGLISETTTQRFSEDVIQESMNQPVLVDFWAPWCGPCRQLTPILERAVNAAKGAVKLVKMNIDDYPEIPSQLGVRSIPAVFAFQQGRPVDGFMGALPESEVKAFIERLTGGAPGEGEGDITVEDAEAAFAAGELEAAAQGFAAILRDNPEEARAIGGLARCYAALGDYERASQVLQSAPEKLQSHGAITAAKAAIELAGEGRDLPDPQTLQKKLDANPSDLETRYSLARALLGQGQMEEAVEHLLTIIEQDRTWNEEAARKKLLQVFDALGPKDPLTQAGRRRLSGMLFS